ncbi:MAG: hypothetical protein B2I17_03245 [Thermoplasmatales archaeon B_DKE]|nr:MAG: hypothetical protein B2I17_03245 [Thermoplasmatales archaeon B_DKE]
MYEKPGIQVLERTRGYVRTDGGKVVRGFKYTNGRNGTLNLFAAPNIMTGMVNSKTTKTKKRPDTLMVDEIHVVLDNYCTHKRRDEWLSAHPNVKFHYTPTSANWLSMVEIFFSIRSREALNGSSFRITDALS